MDLSIVETLNQNREHSEQFHQTQQETHQLFTEKFIPCGYNSNNSYPLNQAFIRMYLTFPTIFLGSIGNLINILVFSNRAMKKSPTNWFLLTLAVADMVLLLASFNMLVVPVWAERFDSFRGRMMAQHLSRWFYPVSQLAQTISVYTVVAVTVHRFLGICHPFFAQRHCTPKSIKLIIFLLITFSTLFTLPRWFHLALKQCYSLTFRRLSVRIHPGSVYANTTYMLLYNVIAYILVMFLIPFTCLCVLDIQLIRAVRRSTNLRTKSVYRGGRYQQHTTMNKKLTTINNHSKSSPLQTGRAGADDYDDQEEASQSLLLNNRTTGQQQSGNHSPIINAQQCLQAATSMVNISTLSPQMVGPALVVRMNGGDSIHPNTLSNNTKTSSSRFSSRGSVVTFTTTGNVSVTPHSPYQKYSSSSSSPSTTAKLLVRSKSSGRQDSKNSSQSDSNSNSTTLRETSITLMLITMVTLFLLCNTLPFLNNIFEHVIGGGAAAAQDGGYLEVFQILVEIGNLLVTINSSAYTAVYYVFNRKYRIIFLRIFCCLCYGGSGGMMGGRGGDGVRIGRRFSFATTTLRNYRPSSVATNHRESTINNYDSITSNTTNINNNNDNNGVNNGVAATSPAPAAQSSDSNRIVVRNQEKISGPLAICGTNGDVDRDLQIPACKALLQPDEPPACDDQNYETSDENNF